MNSANENEPALPVAEDSLPPVAPDFIEQDWPEELDIIIPTRGYRMPPMVDWVLAVADIPRRLLEYYNNGARLKLPPEEGPTAASPPQAPTDEREAALREVLLFLRTRTGRDFTYYKRATILRRIARRMQVNSVEDLRGYLAFLRTHPGESGALLQDLLISVTNFFRDRDAFHALENHIPVLFQNKTHKDIVRVWCPACATGEEAYSMAMLPVEHAGTLDSPRRRGAGSGSVMPLREKSGKLQGFVKIMRDLTENKRKEEALRAHVDELTRFNAAAVGRETRVVEFKQEINELCGRLGEPARYLSEAERQDREERRQGS